MRASFSVASLLASLPSRPSRPQQLAAVLRGVDTLGVEPLEALGDLEGLLRRAQPSHRTQELLPQAHAGVRLPAMQRDRD